MQELGYILFILAVYFLIPFILGSLLFKRLKKKWSWLGGSSKGRRVMAFLVFLLCGLVGWLFEYLILTGIVMML